MTEISDIAALSAIARARGVLVAVDNCFCTPILQQPLSLGADLVVFPEMMLTGYPIEDLALRASFQAANSSGASRQARASVSGRKARCRETRG